MPECVFTDMESISRSGGVGVFPIGNGRSRAGVLISLHGVDFPVWWSSYFSPLAMGGVEYHPGLNI